MIFSIPARALVPLALAGLVACSDTQEHSSLLAMTGGDPDQGRSLIQTHGCGTCHTIEGIRGPRGKVGPRLENLTRQSLLAGSLPNTPRNLIAWLMDPVALKPQTGMPSLGLTEAEARHIATYLYSLGEQDPQVYPPGPALPLREDYEAADIPERAGLPSGTEPRTRRIVPNTDASSGERN